MYKVKPVQYSKRALPNLQPDTTNKTNLLVKCFEIRRVMRKCYLVKTIDEVRHVVTCCYNLRTDTGGKVSTRTPRYCEKVTIK